MKKVKLTLGLLFIASMTTACENFGVLGQGGVKGSDAKAEIIETITTSTFISRLLVGSRSGIAINFLLPSIFVQFNIDGQIVPGLAGIKDGKHYSRNSVDECKDNIKNYDLLISAGSISVPGVTIGSGIAFATIPSGTAIGALQCDLKTTPALIQIGDGDKGSVIQIGPIAL